MNASPPSHSVMVAVPGEVAFLKVTGRANFTASVNFKTVVGVLVSRGVKRVVFDLTNCVNMDSTFLGVLAGFALDPSRTGARAGQPPLQLLNPNARVADLLENLGVAHLFETITCPEPVEATLDATAPTEIKPSREEVSKTCLEAHQTLMAANPGNISKFKDVVRFLAEDLHNAKNPPEPPRGE